ncbi:trypsin-like [Copidosoma floridanum]|uniref:trypsin-like n=1 Tax=Copidosoma floridanum TaxID=29053 RepID=UPI0006C96DFC|nr:trypsin-like [Copidosoma floridanum]
MGSHMLLYLSLFCIISLVTAENIRTRSPNRGLLEYSSRIVNGTRATLGRFPHQVSLRRAVTQNHFCSGTILTSKWVLSAGHCMLDLNNNTLEASSMLIVAGEIVLKNTNRAHAWSKVTKLIVHPQFQKRTLENDIALLKLETPLDFDDRVQPAYIIQRRVNADTMCQVGGWGSTIVEPLSSYFMYIDLPVMSDRLCQELWGNYTLAKGTFCAGYLEGFRDSCTGDSGAGLMCDGFLTGLVSGGGRKCAEPRVPGLYTDVYFFVPWIERYVNLEENVSKLP